MHLPQIRRLRIFPRMIDMLYFVPVMRVALDSEPGEEADCRCAVLVESVLRIPAYSHDDRRFIA